MKNGSAITGVSAAFVIVALAGAPALGQSSVEEVVIPEQAEQQTLTDDLIGQSVYSRLQGSEDLEQVGTIESLLLNEDNRLTGVVLSMGGFLGFGAKSIAIAWDALEIEEFAPTEFVATIDMTVEELENAPAFKTLAEKEAERAQEQMQTEQMQGTGATGTTGGTGLGTGTGGATGGGIGGTGGTATE